VQPSPSCSLLSSSHGAAAAVTICQNGQLQPPPLQGFVSCPSHCRCDCHCGSSSMRKTMTQHCSRFGKETQCKPSEVCWASQVGTTLLGTVFKNHHEVWLHQGGTLANQSEEDGGNEESQKMRVTGKWKKELLGKKAKAQKIHNCSEDQQ